MHGVRFGILILLLLSGCGAHSPPASEAEGAAEPMPDLVEMEDGRLMSVSCLRGIGRTVDPALGVSGCEVADSPAGERGVNVLNPRAFWNGSQTSGALCDYLFGARLGWSGQTCFAVLGFVLARLQRNGSSCESCLGGGNTLGCLLRQSTQSCVGTRTRDIVTIAATNPKFSTLASLVTKAGLADTLKGSGPFTVFAPTNAAFEKLGQATLASVGADIPKLTKILKYHVVSGRYDSTALTHLLGNGWETNLPTLGGLLKLLTTGSGLALRDSVKEVRITRPDVDASNGVIHVIDSVLIPR